MNYKVCTKCGKEFPATEEFFYKQKTGKFGLHATCKTCRNKQNQEYCKNNPECKQKEINKIYDNELAPSLDDGIMPDYEVLEPFI